MAARFFDGKLSGALTRFFGSTVSERSASNPRELEEMLRHTDGGVTEHSAMRVASVFACVSLLSRSQGMLPLRLHKMAGESETKAVEHPVYRILAVRPNRWQTPYDFEAMMTAHKHIRGNAYAFVSRLGGAVKELIPLNPARMRVEQDGDLSLKYVYRLPGGKEKVYAQADIHHRRGLSTDGITGMSPIAAARRAISLAMKMESHSDRTFDNAAKPSGALKSPKPLTTETAQRLKSSFDSVYAGGDNAGKTIVLEDGLDWVQIGMSAEDLQFIDGRKLQRSEIAMFFGVPPHMIGDVERGTSWGSGIEQQSLGFLVHTLNPHLVNDQQALARDLLSPDEALTHVVRHDTAVLTRAEFYTRQQGLAIQHQNGVINADEWRKIEGLNPRSDGKGQEYRSAGSAPAAPVVPQDQVPRREGRAA